MDIPILEAVGKASDLVTAIVKRVLPEKMSESEAANLNQAITMALLDGQNRQVLGQLAINQEEAKSTNLFIAGWRPFVGWVCGSAFAYTFVAQPLFIFLVTILKWQAPPLPALDMGSLLAVLGALLGVGGLRTVEKVKGAEGNR